MPRSGLRIGEVAARAGVSCDTLRHYERLGLLTRVLRTPAGYRLYSEAVLERIRLVRCAVRFGFSLREIAGFLRIRDGGGAPCHQVRSVATRLLEAADHQIAELVATRDLMRQTVAAWDDLIARTPAGRPARLLDGLPPSLEAGSVRSRLPRNRGTRRPDA